MKKIFQFSVLIFAALSLPAHAYVPPPSFIINKMVKDRGALKNIEIVGKVTQLKSHITFKEITKIDFSSGKVHSQYVGEAGENLGEVSLKLNQSHPLGLAWLGVGMSSSSAVVNSFLEQLGLSLTQSPEAKLKRIQTHPVWEVGDHSVMKIDKDQFVLLGFDENHQNGFEADATSVVGTNVRILKSIRFKKDAIEQYTYELQESKVNQKTISTAGNIKNAPQALVQGWIELVH